MPFISAISSISLSNRVSQDEVKKHVKDMFSPVFPEVERLAAVFDHAEIRHRNFCQPLEYYANNRSFEEKNNDYINYALSCSIEAIEDCLKKSGVKKEEVTDLFFVSSTGLATPSIDALIINKLRLNPHVNRTPIFGLGCGGGVSGIVKANCSATANPDAVVLLVTVELCSLCFLRDDYSKSNFIASSLFSDGIAAAIVKGDGHKSTSGTGVNFIDSYSKLYYDSLDVMGWEFLSSGFKVVFSTDIPAIIHENIKNDIADFLSRHRLTIGDIRHFIFHPGGKKVIEAYVSALELKGEELKNTSHILEEYGNMSSATVLYVFEKFLREKPGNGHALMLALGPGFSSEMALYSIHN